ncbi:MAG: hypothetical protein IJE89_03110 [Bacilli bacterium]|nr:hypothetical protein [Bacilli bacterium]
MENRRGSGIFLGVVGVATLVVAIIGATFAYFSASATATNTVDLQAYEFNATLSLHQVSPTSANTLIPMDPEVAVEGATDTNNTNLLYALNKAGCVDSHGLQVCAVYKATIVNSGSNDLTLSRTLTTTVNTAGSTAGATGFVNLKYLDLTGPEGSFAHGTLTDNVKDIESVVGEYVELGNITVGADDTEELYFVVYLDEVEKDTANPNSNNPEMGSVFQGTLTFADSGYEHQLTATFNVGA